MWCCRGEPNEVIEQAKRA
jgi:hypothetical protein